MVIGRVQRGPTQCHDVCVIGAGPFGLTVAAHLRAAGFAVRVFGEVMSFWRRMPEGMLLRSTRAGISLHDPARPLALADYERAERTTLATPVVRAEYIRYVEWYQRQAVPDIDPRTVRRVDRTDGGFLLALDDGERVATRRLVVAVGLDPFKRRLPVFDGLPPERAPHSFDERTPAAHAGRSVVVIGSGQSALESAAALVHAGAEVEVITRAAVIHWLANNDHIDRDRSLLSHLLYPPGALGPPGINWIVQLPGLFRALPGPVQARVAARAARPAVSGRLRPCAERLTIAYGRSVTGAALDRGRVRLALDDGTERIVDHVVQGTGFRVEMERFGFLSPEIVAAIRTLDGQPRLGPGYESSIPGLHFVGAASDASYGPLMRAIAGTAYAAHAVAARAAARERSVPVSRGRTMEMLEQGMSLVPGIAGSAAAVAVVGAVAPALGVDAGPVLDLVRGPNDPSVG